MTTPVMLMLDAHPGLGKVRYTIDGTEPSARSPVADKPIRVADNFTLQARLFDAAGKPVKALFTQPCVFEPLKISGKGMQKDAAGKDSTWFTDTMTATIDSTIKSGRIRYTVDGSDPVPMSPVFSSAIRLKHTTVLKARWFDEKNVGRGATTTATFQKLASEKHTAVGKPAKILVPADLENGEAAAKLLVDGLLIRGSDWGRPRC